MTILGLALLIALCIPIVGLLVDSPIGRGIGERLSRRSRDDSQQPPEVIADLIKRIDLLEGDVELLQHHVRELGDETEFLQKLLEEGGPAPGLPPDRA